MSTIAETDQLYYRKAQSYDRDEVSTLLATAAAASLGVATTATNPGGAKPAGSFYMATSGAGTYAYFLDNTGTAITIPAPDAGYAIIDARLTSVGSYWLASWQSVLLPSPDITSALVPVNDKIGQLSYELPSYNLLDPALLQSSKYYSNVAGGISTSASYKSWIGIPVTEGKTYAISHYNTNSGGYLDASNAGKGQITFSGTSPGALSFTVPTGLGIVSVVINNLVASSAETTEMMNAGATALPFEAFSVKHYLVPTASMIDGAGFANAASYVTNNFSVGVGKNLFQAGTERAGKAYSNSSHTITTNSNYNAAVIPVTEGKQYTVSGFQGTVVGGFLLADETPAYGTSTSTNIVFSSTTGGGKTFTIPVGASIGKVIININGTGSADKTYVNTFQFEQSDVATPYEAYNTFPVFAGLATKNSSGGSVVQSSAAASIEYPGIFKKFPNFTQHFFKKDKDVCLVMNGTSLLRNAYSSAKSNASTRPPLMDTNNLASALFDKLIAFWPGQQYRRFDASGYFTETGTFLTTQGDGNWDDNTYRLADTRFSTSATAQTVFKIPVGAWQFNFIYRTDSAGTSQARVVVAEGNGFLQVYNGSSWVEANGYDFSMVESAATTTKGNTTYQKRLKMRCKGGTLNSLTTEKNVTIKNQAGTGRFLYWGVEWSPRDTMFTLINASRGSHQWNSTSTSQSLTKFQDNEMYSFNPDLIFFELTLINYGATTFSSVGTRTPSYYTDLLAEWVFNASNADSLAGRTGTFATIETVMFTDTPSILAGAFDATSGAPLFAINSAGINQTCLDNFQAAVAFMLTKDVAFVDYYSRFKKYAEVTYGTIYAAMNGTGITGNSLSYDGTHWNDNGQQLAITYLLPAFDFA